MFHTKAPHQQVTCKNIYTANAVKHCSDGGNLYCTYAK